MTATVVDSPRTQDVAPPAAPEPSRRSFAVLAAAGFVATAFIVVAGGRVGPVAGSVPFSRWWGLLRHEAVPLDDPLPGLALTSGLVIFVLIWLRAHHSLAFWPVRRLWSLALIWATPLILGPPLLSSDVYAYVAQGAMVAHGQDPYTLGPNAAPQASSVAVSAAVNAVDPRWRDAHSPYGPLATALEHLAFDIGRGPLGAVIVLRLVAVASVVAIGVLAMSLTDRRHPAVFAFTTLNPVVLLQVVSASHFEGVMGALVLASLVALRHQRTYLALTLACAAGLVKAPALVVVGVIAIVAWRRAEPGRARRVRIAVCMAGTVAAASFVFSTVVPDGWGWISSMSTPGQGFTPAAPASLAAIVLTPFTVWTGLTTWAALLESCRLVAMGISGIIVLWLLATCRRRSPSATAGSALLTIALLGPVIYPWYLLWGLICLAPGSEVHDRRRDVLLILSALGSLMTVQGLAPTTIGVLATLIVLVIGTWAYQRLVQDSSGLAKPGYGLRLGWATDDLG